MNVYIENTGCTRRKLDLAKLTAYFEVNGFRIVPESETADYILVSTCALKKEEEENSMQMLDSYRTSKGKVLVYGCLPAIAPTRYKHSFDFDFISPSNINSIDRYFRHITHRFADIKDANIIVPADEHAAPAVSPATAGSSSLTEKPLKQWVRYVRNKYLGRNSAFYLFSSRGCLGNCSYCAARFAIGTLRSKQIPVVVDEFNRGIESGYRDFTIIGDDVGAFGMDNGTSFPELFAALVDEVERKRTGTAANARNTIRLYIDEFHPCWVMKYEKEMRQSLRHRCVAGMLCPLQSGNDRILTLMKRYNDTAAVSEVLSDLHRLNARIRLDTKVMAGFPSETDDDFNETLVKLGGLPLSSVKIIPYEEKENTPACSIEPKVTARDIGERVRKARKYFRQRGIRSTLSCKGT